MAKRTTWLIGEIQRDPFSGIGKPEPLKGDLSGYWSRRIDEHRLVYRAGDKEVKILKARYHYGNDRTPRPRGNGTDATGRRARTGIAIYVRNSGFLGVWSSGSGYACR